MIRVFPRKTKATPDDNDVRIGGPHLWDHGQGQEVLISCTFTWDLRRCEALAKQWKDAGFAPRIGGPACGDPGGEFEPGMFVKKGMTTTSRGCNNTKCWFCSVPQREGKIRELAIKDGHNIMDNNLLQCTDDHIKRVFAMLDRQKEPARFTGGLDPAALTYKHVEMIAGLKRTPGSLYFAYDTPDDKDPLFEAARWMRVLGFDYQRVACYVLMGYPKDTIDEALERIQLCIDLNMQPFAMLYDGHKPTVAKEWKEIQNIYTRPARCKRRHKGQFGRFFR